MVSGSIFERDVTISKLEYHQQISDETIKKIQLKKDSLEEENKELKMEVNKLRMELMRASTNEKNYSVALLFSWVFFGFFKIFKR